MMSAFGGLVGKHLARKLASRLGRDFEVWQRDQGQRFQGVLQDLKQMGEELGMTGEGYAESLISHPG